MVAVRSDSYGAGDGTARREGRLGVGMKCKDTQWDCALQKSWKDDLLPRLSWWLLSSLRILEVDKQEEDLIRFQDPRSAD